jgi:hypothetical protein
LLQRRAKTKPPENMADFLSVLDERGKIELKTPTHREHRHWPMMILFTRGLASRVG